MTYPKYGSTEYFQRRLRIAQAIEELHMCAGYPDYRLAMALLTGATEKTYPCHRSLLSRIVDALNCAVREFRRKAIVVPPSAP